MTNDFIIEVNHVFKQFEDGKYALNDVSLQVKKGEFVTILAFRLPVREISCSKARM